LSWISQACGVPGLTKRRFVMGQSIRRIISEISYGADFALSMKKMRGVKLRAHLDTPTN